MCLNRDGLPSLFLSFGRLTGTSIHALLALHHCTLMYNMNLLPVKDRRCAVYIYLYIYSWQRNKTPRPSARLVMLSLRCFMVSLMSIAVDVSWAVVFNITTSMGWTKCWTPYSSDSASAIVAEYTLVLCVFISFEWGCGVAFHDILGKVSHSFFSGMTFEYYIIYTIYGNRARKCIFFRLFIWNAICNAVGYGMLRALCNLTETSFTLQTNDFGSSAYLHTLYVAFY